MATVPGPSAIGGCALPEIWNVMLYGAAPVSLTRMYSCVVAGNSTFKDVVRVPDRATYV